MEPCRWKSGSVIILVNIQKEDSSNKAAQSLNVDILCQIGLQELQGVVKH